MDEPRSPTGEPHRDPIQPWQVDAWSKKLGISETEVRQLSAEVGPVYEEIEQALRARLDRRMTQDAIRETQRDGEPA